MFLWTLYRCAGKTRSLFFVFVSQCHVADGIESHGRVTSRYTTQRRHVIHTDAPHFVLLVAATVPRGSNRPTFLFFHATFVIRSRKEFGVSTIHLCTVTLVLCDANLDAGRSVFLEAPRCRSGRVAPFLSQSRTSCSHVFNPNVWWESCKGLHRETLPIILQKRIENGSCWARARSLT